MKELKTCPFCGGMAAILRSYRWPPDSEERIMAFSPVCINIDCFFHHADDAYFRTPEEAAEAWNRRADDDA